MLLGLLKVRRGTSLRIAFFEQKFFVYEYSSSSRAIDKVFLISDKGH